MTRHIAAPLRAALLAGVTAAIAAFAPGVTSHDVSPGRVTAQSLRVQASTTQCDSASSYWFNSISEVVTGADSLSTELRQLYNLPAVSANDVSVVMDSATCVRAARALGLALSPPDTLTQRTVSVIRIGPTRFVVTDSSVRAGEFIAHYVFDSAFTHPPLAGLAQ
jgi:hypothetical protein